MNCKLIKKLPSTKKCLRELPLPVSEDKKIKQHREEIKNILAGMDRRIIIIVGPCSAWPKEAVLEYAEKLYNLSEKVKDRLKIIMRVYIQKPRTKIGWLGPAIQSDPFAQPNADLGIKYCREMMLRIVKMGLPIGSELLFTHICMNFVDLLSWACIGARSSENQEHRIFASAIDYPVGFKNTTHGPLKIIVNSVLVAQHFHTGVFNGYEIQTRGNEYAHVVLRGSNGKHNYSLNHLEEIKKHLEEYKIKNPSIFIDASHDNCMVNGKNDYRLQPKIIAEVLDCLDDNLNLRSLVKGFMIESFLLEGKQDINIENTSDMQLNGLSVTDPCLGWEQTEKLVLDLFKRYDK